MPVPCKEVPVPSLKFPVNREGKFVGKPMLFKAMLGAFIAAKASKQPKSLKIPIYQGSERRRRVIAVVPAPPLS